MRLALALLIACAPAWANAQPKAPPAMPVRAVVAKLAPAVDEATAVGTLRADEAVTVRPEIAGRIAEIRFKEGQRVERGSVLVRLDQAELGAVLASSQAQAGLEAQRLERAEDMFKKGFIAQQALDEQRANHVRGLAKVREDEARLAKTVMRAPFPGVMGLRQVSEGAYVAAGTDIARLEKIDELKLDFRVPELLVGRLRPGQAVRVQLDAYGEQLFPGKVYAIEPAVDEATRTVLVRARVANPEGKLRPGMFARVRAQLAVRQNAVWVPEQAIVPRGQDAFVYRVVDGKAEQVKVQTGVRKVGEVEIVQGIAAGDQVVTEGTQRLGPGSAVTVMQAPPKPAAAAPDKKG
ncbi:MAG: efflux RND transporter periplasmic adaptor subunit [Betaproteobacteria bacterium]|nr:efflux RND transporter periplasmic adaptor subunit [Betaproteobacteria bacterium]MDH5221672.1 efflux RND transporter periplasmic adaptor subunit [Betaproteobacteria bacterium]MDH5351577.1 efflux RND transporter periplasmic adaptor subunit [Betaproteobacteria bacterium]